MKLRKQVPFLFEKPRKIGGTPNHVRVSIPKRFWETMKLKKGDMLEFYWDSTKQEFSCKLIKKEDIVTLNKTSNSKQLKGGNRDNEETTNFRNSPKGH